MTSKIVPREPTQEMLDAGFGPFLGAHDPMFSANEPCGPIWKMMYDAAPAMEKPADHAATEDTDHLCARLDVAGGDRAVTDYGAANIMAEAATAIRELREERDRLRDALLETFACYDKGGTLAEDTYAIIDAARATNNDE